MLIRPTDFDRADLDIIKQEVFTQDAFRVTETQQVGRFLKRPFVSRGNGNPGGARMCGRDAQHCTLGNWPCTPAVVFQHHACRRVAPPLPRPVPAVSLP